VPTTGATSTRRLIVLHRDDFNRARTVAPELLTDPSLLVVAVPLRPPDDENPELRALEPILVPDTLLLRNLWQPGYIEAATAYERLSVEKFNLFALICQLLGAYRLEVREIREVTESGNVTGTVAFSGAVARGSGSLASDTLNRLAQSIQGTWNWAGGRPDADAAERLAEEFRLSADPMINGLMRQRRYAGNTLTEHQLELDISSEAQREIQAALKVESIARKLGPSFEATFRHLRHQTQNLRLSVRVVFGADAHG
jgi:hypothetical protein